MAFKMQSDSIMSKKEKKRVEPRGGAREGQKGSLKGTGRGATKTRKYRCVVRIVLGSEISPLKGKGEGSNQRGPTIR